MVFVAIWPPHVHVYAWGIAVAFAALMGALATPVHRIGPVGACIAAIASLLLTVNLALSLQQLQSARTLAMWGAYLCVFIYCAGLRTSRAGQYLILPGSIALAGTALAAHGLYQSLYAFERLGAIASDQGLPDAVRARIGSGRAVATFGLPDALSGLLAMSLPVTIWLAVTGERRSARRWLFLALALIQAAGLVATWSAGGIASLALAGAAVIWWRGHAGGGAARRRLAIAVVAVGLAGAALLLAVRVSGPAGEGNPLLLREGNWKVALEVLGDHPMLGAGAGCFGVAFPPHRAWGMNESQFVHNSYLQVLAETGAPAGLLAAIVAACFGWSLLRSSTNGFLAAALLTFLVHNGADFTFYVPSVGLTFFCLAGLAAADRPDHGVARPAGAGRIPRCLAALGLASFALLLTRADLMRQAAREAVVEGRPERSEALARIAISRNPFDPEARSLISHLLLDRAARMRQPGPLGEAEREARAAVDLDPATPHHWNHLGRVLLARGDTQGAYIALTRAAQLYPIKIEYRNDRDMVGAALARNKAPG